MNDDILFIVFSFLFNRPMVRTLSLVCRQWCQIVRAILKPSIVSSMPLLSLLHLSSLTSRKKIFLQRLGFPSLIVFLLKNEFSFFPNVMAVMVTTTLKGPMFDVVVVKVFNVLVVLVFLLVETIYVNMLLKLICFPV